MSAFAAHSILAPSDVVEHGTAHRSAEHRPASYKRRSDRVRALATQIHAEVRDYVLSTQKLITLTETAINQLI